MKLISFGRKDSNPKQAYRSLSQIGEYFKSGFSEIDARFESLAGEDRVNLLADMLRGEHHLPFSYRDLTRSGQTTYFLTFLIIAILTCVDMVSHC